MSNEMITNTTVLTLDSDTVLETAQSKADLIWHEIQNAYRTRKILTGMLGGIEKTETGSLIAIIYYKDFRTVIPVTEMMINLVQDDAHDYGELSLRQNKILNNMLGCEIDFIVKGLDAKTRSIVASRKEAMLKKRQIFYLEKDANGTTKVHEAVSYTHLDVYKRQVIYLLSEKITHLFGFSNCFIGFFSLNCSNPNHFIEPSSLFSSLLLQILII